MRVLLICAASVLLSGCAAKVISASPRSVVVDARPGSSISEAQQLASAECAKHQRQARYVGRDFPATRALMFDCVQ